MSIKLGNNSFIFFAILILFCGNIFAQKNNFSFDHLDLHDGLSQSSINCIMQDEKGFMWFGTQDGLHKYDGYEFEIFKHSNKDTSSISNNNIHVLVQDKSGAIWIGTDNGLNIFNPIKKEFTKINFTPKGQSNMINSLLLMDDKIIVGTANYGVYQILLAKPYQATCILRKQNNPINTLYIDKQNTLWIGSNNSGLISYNLSTKKETIYSYQANNFKGISNNTVWTIFEDKKGFLWIGTNDGLNYLDKKTGLFEVIKNDVTKPNSLSNNVVKFIFRDKSNTIWIATFGGLNKYNGQQNSFTRLQYSPENKKGINSNKVYCIDEDRTGTIWVGTESGINKFDRIQNNFKYFTPRNSFNLKDFTNNVWCIYEDEADKSLMVGTDGGLTIFQRNYYIANTYKPTKNGQPSFGIYAIAKDSKGTFWVGTENGLYNFNKHTFQFTLIKGFGNQKLVLENKFVLCIKEDSNKNLWVGTKDGLFEINEDRNNVNSYFNKQGNSNSLASNDIRAIFEDASKNLWFATNGGGLNKLLQLKQSKNTNDSKIFKHYINTANKESSISSNNVFAIAQTQPNGLWIGTNNGGLNYFDERTEKFIHFTEEQGLSNNTIYNLLTDKNGNIWMSTNNGLCKYIPNKSTFISYYENDGLQSNEFNSGAAFKSNEGELFFGGVEGFNAFFPDKILTDTIAPSTVITALKIFNKTIDVNQGKVLKENISYSKEILLSYKQNFFTIEFAAMHFSSPENNEFKYMMEGVDEDWNYVGSQHQAFYTNLEPGDYTFKVLGANSDGTYSRHPAILHISITPPLWKSWPFRIAAIVLALLLFFMWYKTRMNRVVKQKKILEKQVRDRTAMVLKQKEEIEEQKSVIELQKKKTESLVHNILPKETAEELINKGYSRPRSYSLCTVMFTDFEGFTKVAEKMRPQQLIDELDKYFSKFDEIVGKYNIERIKTIGDSYMCAGGIPIRNKSNPIEAVLAALEIQRFMETSTFEINGKKHVWKLRIGINTGEIIAGVIGKTKFAFDIWGDTVNTASRTEASGEAGKVNITKATYEYIKDFFVCEYRGKIAAKNKSDIDMYFVERIKPALSLDDEGKLPNKLFQDKFSQLLLDKFSYKKSEQRILKLLSERLPEGLYYHGLHHTIDVTNAAEEIARAEGIDGEDLFLLKTAALFHDAGFVQEYVKNEGIGANYAGEVLPKYGYSESQIDTIKSIIMATEIPQNPHSHLEQIMCDADLDYLGRADFHEISDSLRKELVAFGKIKGQKQWDTMQIPFLETHRYFTKTNQLRRQDEKEKRIEEIKKRLEEDKYDD